MNQKNNYPITGHTETYGEKKIHYILVSAFEKIFKISKRTLMRYREKITANEPLNEHYLYFKKRNRAYWYSINILEFKRYKRANKHHAILEDAITIDHGIFKLESTGSAIFNGLLSIPWDYIGSVNYVGKKELYECVENMEMLYNCLIKEFPSQPITFYYTTEKKHDRYHNHFLLSISGEKEKTTRRIRKCVRETGACSAFVEPYRKEGAYLEYSTKEVSSYPDGWRIKTNSLRDLHTIKGINGKFVDKINIS